MFTKRRLIVAVLCLFAGLQFLAQAVFSRDVDSGVREPVESLSYDLRRRLTFRFRLLNEYDVPRYDVEFRAPLPLSRTAVQEVIGVDVSEPHQSTSDHWGNQGVVIRFDEIAPYSTRVVDIRAELKLATEPNRLNDQSADVFLVSEQFIEVNDHHIQQLAGELLRPSKKETAAAVFQWITSRISPVSYTGEEFGALHAYRARSADSSGQAFLFVALMRANRIPARVVAGYFADRDGVVHDQEFRSWAEYFAEGVWHLADCANSSLDQDAHQYIATQVITPSTPLNPTRVLRYYISDPNIVVSLR